MQRSEQTRWETDRKLSLSARVIKFINKERRSRYQTPPAEAPLRLTGLIPIF